MILQTNNETQRNINMLADDLVESQEDFKISYKDVTLIRVYMSA